MASLQSTIYTAGPDAKMSIRVAGADDPVSGGVLDHRYILSFGGATVDTSVSDFTLSSLSLISSAAALQASPNAFSLRLLATYAANTRNAVGSLEIEIPQTYNLGNRIRHVLYIPDNAGGNKYTLNITAFNAQNTAVTLYDNTNNRRIPMIGGGTNWNSGYSQRRWIKNLLY